VLNLCQVIGPLYSLWSHVVEILVFFNKFAPLCSLRCLVGPLFETWSLLYVSVLKCCILAIIFFKLDPSAGEGGWKIPGGHVLPTYHAYDWYCRLTKKLLILLKSNVSLYSRITPNAHCQSPRHCIRQHSCLCRCWSGIWTSSSSNYLFLVQQKNKLYNKLQSNTKIKPKKGYSNKTVYVMTCKKLYILKYCTIKSKCMVTAPCSAHVARWHAR